MKIGIRNDSIYKNYTEKLTDEQIVTPPYNYQIVEVNEAYEDCEIMDFDLINNAYSFNVEKYNSRIKAIANNERVAELKANLTATDYKAIKYAEGEITAEEYAETKEQRRAWREEINQLEE